MSKDDNQKEDKYFIEKRALGELFDSSYALNVNLYRGRNPNNKDPIIYPILKSFLMSNGRVRQEDIKTYTKSAELWVRATSGGISLFDVKGIPVKSWEYYLLKIGIEIPFGLVITKDEYKERFKATHYTIRPNWDMPVAKFCRLLDELTQKITRV